MSLSDEILELNIGKLVRTTNEKCSDCGKPIQIRRITNSILVEQVNIEEGVLHDYCPNCKVLTLRVDKKNKRKNPRRQLSKDIIEIEGRIDKDEKSKGVRRNDKQRS